MEITISGDVVMRWVPERVHASGALGAWVLTLASGDEVELSERQASRAREEAREVLRREDAGA